MAPETSASLGDHCAVAVRTTMAWPALPPATTSTADFTPALVAVMSTSIVQIALAGRATPEQPATTLAKSAALVPPSVTRGMPVGRSPVLDTVKVRGALARFSMPETSADFGAMTTAGGESAVPVRVTVKEPLLVWMASVVVFTPELLGAK